MSGAWLVLEVLAIVSSAVSGTLLGALGLGMFIRPGVRHMTPLDVGTTFILLGLGGAFLWGAWLGVQAALA